MHGNEVTGREFLIFLASFLCTNYQNDIKIQSFLTDTRILILPTLNPDGFAKRSKKRFDTSQYNSNYVYGRSTSTDVDLNRDFGQVSDKFYRNPTSAFSSSLKEDFQTVETRLAVKLFEEYSIDFALNYHDGAKVVTYGLDQCSFCSSSEFSPAPDHEIFHNLALKYTEKMKQSSCSNFDNGVSNGAEWYSIKGSMADYHYLVHGALHLTVEVNCVKYPSPKELEAIIEEQKEMLFSWLEFIRSNTYKVESKVKNFVETENEVFVEFKRGGDSFFTWSDSGRFKKVLPNAGVYELFINHERFGTFDISSPYTYL